MRQCLALIFCFGFVQKVLPSTASSMLCFALFRTSLRESVFQVGDSATACHFENKKWFIQNELLFFPWAKHKKCQLWQAKAVSAIALFCISTMRQKGFCSKQACGSATHSLLSCRISHALLHCVLHGHRSVLHSSTWNNTAKVQLHSGATCSWLADRINCS